MLFLCFLIGLVLAIIISISKSSYLGLLNVKDKTMLNIINGTLSPLLTFWKTFSSFLVPLILIFIFSLNRYIVYFNIAVFIYQSTLFFLTSLALVESYNFLGIIKILFVMLPINLAYFVIMMFWIVSCIVRTKESNRKRQFGAGFNNLFFQKLYMCLIALFLLSLIVGVVVPILLKSAIFISY